MEPWQVAHIQGNKYSLQQNTVCNSSFRAVLQEHKVLAENDISHMDAVQSSKGTHTESELLYKLLVTREGAYNALIDACDRTRQTGALSILRRATAPVCTDVPGSSSAGSLDMVEVTNPGDDETKTTLKLRYDGKHNISNEEGKLILRKACLKLSRQLTNVVNNERVLQLFESEGILDPLEAEAIQINIRTITTSAWITQFCKLLENRADVGKALNLLLNLDNDQDLKNYRSIIKTIFEALDFPK